MSNDYDLWNICWLLMVWTFIVPILWGVLGQVFYPPKGEDDQCHNPWKDEECSCCKWDVEDDDDWDDEDDGEGWKRGER